MHPFAFGQPQKAAKGSPDGARMPLDNPRQSIYALRGWIDRIEQDARADAAKKYATVDAKPATPPSDNPWGPGVVSIRLTPEHGCASGPPTRGSVVTPSPTEAPRPSPPRPAERRNGC